MIDYNQAPALAELQPIGISNDVPAYIGSVLTPKPMGPWAIERHPYEAQTSDNSSDLEQQCIDSALAMPQILNPPTMYRAGIRPFTPHHYHTQNMWGVFGYAPVTATDGTACSSLERVSGGQIQMQKRGDREVWINDGPPHNPGWIGNQAGRSELSYGPAHPFPDYLFNECQADGKGFLKVRIVMDSKVKNGQTHETVDEEKYIVPVPVKGNCRVARASEKATKDIRATWGDR